jgi:hypothetical protein
MSKNNYLDPLQGSNAQPAGCCEHSPVFERLLHASINVLPADLFAKTQTIDWRMLCFYNKKRAA